MPSRPSALPASATCFLTFPCTCSHMQRRQVSADAPILKLAQRLPELKSCMAAQHGPLLDGKREEPAWHYSAA